VCERNFRGNEGYAYHPLSKVGGTVPPTFERYKRPSFELKLRGNVCAAGAEPRTPLGGACSTLPDHLARLRALLLKGREGGGGMRKGGMGEEKRG